MISIKEEVEVSATAERVWAVLKDPMVVVGCVPGAQLKSEVEPGKYLAAIAVKFGPTLARFNGEANVAYDDATRTCTVSGRGNDMRGASPVLGSGVIRVTGDRMARLAIDGTFEVSGPLEPFISTGGVVVARALLTEFARNLSRLLQTPDAGEEAAGQADVPRPALPSAAPISAGGLFWRILTSQFARLFGFLTRRKKDNG